MQRFCCSRCVIDNICLISQVKVDFSDKTLLQMQVLIHKMQTITDVHESHQLGVGFVIPFVGTLDLDFHTILSISVGVTFELIVLNVRSVPFV